MAENKKAKHKDYEKNRRMKLNEELKANEASNELLAACPKLVRSKLQVHDPAHGNSSPSSDPEDSDDDTIKANKRTILQRTCAELQSLADVCESEYEHQYRSPADMENLAFEAFADCLVLHFELETGYIIQAMGNTKTVFGVDKNELFGKSLWSFLNGSQDAYLILFKSFEHYWKKKNDPTFETLMTFICNGSRQSSTMQVTGRFSEVGEANNKKVLCAVMLTKEEVGDKDYDESETSLCVNLEGIITGVGAGFERVFMQWTEEQLRGKQLSEILLTNEKDKDTADLVFRYHIRLVENGDVNPEESQVFSDLYYAVGKNREIFYTPYKLTMKHIADPGDMDRFILIGTILILTKSTDPILNSNMSTQSLRSNLSNMSL